MNQQSISARRKNKAIAAREQQAARFAARLYSGRMSESDEQELELWLARSPDNRAEYAAALDTWRCVGELTASVEPVDYPFDGRWRRVGWAAAAVLVMAVVASWLVLKPAPQVVAPSITSYTTAVGEQLPLILADGSRVTLNTDSRLLVDFSDSVRRVLLQRGQVFFEVIPDPARPFVVDTGNRVVTVLGTRFDVQKKGFQLTVAVVDGLVAVHRSEDTVTSESQAQQLIPDGNPPNTRADQYRLAVGVEATFSGNLGSSAATVTTRKITNVESYPDWRYGLVRFDDRPLYEVVKEINRYTQKKVLIEDNTIMDMKVSGVFRLNNLEESLDSFEVAFPLQITRLSDRIVIVGRQ